ncbi:MAG: preprotein translocase subunit SecD [Parcubacteria group bacterium Gr01-1014_33]|nr:MAG: preprotein translocase subunit SecD [Parcubacteria group bacterium Gr01-1014_33]
MRSLVLLFMMAVKTRVARSKLLKPGTARLVATGFLVCGILLGIFDAPAYADRILSRARFFGKITDFQFHRSFLAIPYRLGLDIQGGAHLLYQADLGAIPSGERAASMDAVRDVVERRVNLFGVAEPLVRVEKSGGDWRLSVELAGVKDISSAIKLIGETPYLEFKEERSPDERDTILEGQKKGEYPMEDPYFIPTKLTGRSIKKAEVIFDPTTYKPEIGLELTGEGAQLFSEITKKNIGKRLAIYLDGAPISAPVVQQEITGGKAQITGAFTPEEAKALVGRLNSGALPVPIKLIAQETVGASLGEESLARSVYAGMIGFAAVAIFMILWYRLPGMVAVAALLLYAAIMLAVCKLIPVTLSVAGIAGFILSIGMAVDANILIFERMKEEMRAGKTLEEAIREGFGRAWTSIRDSNASSLITAAILYWFGASIVRGFALTLAIGVLVSMFSAISVTRTLLLAIMIRPLQRVRFLFLSGIAK